MGRPISRVEITEAEREELQRRVKASSVSKRDSLRAAIVLRRTEGVKQAEVTRELGVSVQCVNRWSQRFEREGLEGLVERGRRPSIPPDEVEQVFTRATQPPKPHKRWTVRTMAREAGILGSGSDSI